LDKILHTDEPADKPTGFTETVKTPVVSDCESEKSPEPMKLENEKPEIKYKKPDIKDETPEIKDETPKIEPELIAVPKNSKFIAKSDGVIEIVKPEQAEKIKTDEIKKPETDEKPEIEPTDTTEPESVNSIKNLEVESDGKKSDWSEGKTSHVIFTVKETGDSMKETADFAQSQTITRKQPTY
jgi:hypothetical protein